MQIMKWNVLPMLLLFAMCNPAENNSGPLVDGQMMTERLTVVNKTGLDGCGFLLLRQDSTLLEPVNLAVDYQKDLLLLDVSYRLLDDRMSTCMAGNIVEITEVKLVKP